MMKQCPTCKVTKPFSEFRKKAITTLGNPSFGKCSFCEKAYDLARRRKKGIPARKPKVVKVYHKRKMHPTVKERIINPKIQDKTCKECSAPFKGFSKTKYCTRKCCKKATLRNNRIKQKALLRSATVETVNPTIVFIKCNWYCVHCGTHTPQSLRGLNYDNSPELDHIIPLSKGGDHSYANTQLLCRRCNRGKSDTMPSNQSQYGRGDEQSISASLLTALSKKFVLAGFSIRGVMPKTLKSN